MQNTISLAWLIKDEGTPDEVRFEITDSEITLGRASTCEIQLDDPLASRQHAVIRYRAGRFEIEDLDSSNGTFVNNERITIVPLSENDIIDIGSTSLRIRLEQDQDATIVQMRSPEVTIAALKPTVPHEHGAIHCRACGQPNPKAGKFCLKCEEALPQLPDSFQKTLEAFLKAKKSYQTGELKSEDYHAALEELVVQDDQGDYWMLGVESGEWYWYDGDEWNLRLPPLIQPDEKQTQKELSPDLQEPEQLKETPPIQTKRGRWGVVALWLIGAVIVLAFGVYTTIELINYSRFLLISQPNSLIPAEIEESLESIDTSVSESSAAPIPTIYAQDTRNEINARPFDPATDSSLLSVSEQTEFLPEQSTEEYARYEGSFPPDSPGLLIMAWCSIDQDTLENNMAYIRMEGTFDSITIPPEMWTVENSQEEGMYCRFFRAVVEDLEPGTHKFFWSTSYDVPIFDGWETYPPGTYINEFQINIIEGG